MRNSKKLLCMLLSLIMVFSVFTVLAVPAGAYNSDGDFSKLSPDGYNPADSYTVDANTPYSEEAILVCGGDLSETQTMYFQAPADWANEFNTFEGPDDSEPYMHVCAYWWSGIAGSDDMGWPSGKGCKWVGYQAHLVDKANRIYAIKMPNDGGSPTVVWNNGVNGGMDESAAIFKFGRQILDANTEGAVEGDFDTLPEGSPTQDDFDGCIQIIDYSVKRPNPLTGIDSYGYNWYVYYGKGCYGSYSTTSDHFTSRYDNCLNPEHLADPDKYHPALYGDVNRDKETDVIDAELIQEYLVKLENFTDTQKAYADVDDDSFISAIDSTRIHRYTAGICNIDGTRYRYKLPAKSDPDLRDVAALETQPAEVLETYAPETEAPMTEPTEAVEYTEATEPAPTQAPETEAPTEAPMTEPTQPATHGPEQPIDPTEVYINADGDIYEVTPGNEYTYTYYLSNGGRVAGLDATTKFDAPVLTMMGEPEYPLFDNVIANNKYGDKDGNVNEIRFTYSSANGADFSSTDSKLVTFKVKVSDYAKPGIYKIFTNIITLADENEEKQIFNGTDVTPEKITRREGVVDGTWIRKDRTEYTVTNGKHTIGDTADLLFTVNGAKDDEFIYSKFRALYIDGQPVSYENFDTETGSLKLTLKASYMDTLAVGDHIMKYEFSDGTALGTLSIIKREYATPTESHVGPGGNKPHYGDGNIYFDAASAGWSGVSWISFYIYGLGGEGNITEWGSKNKWYTSNDGDIWAFNAKDAGMMYGHEYGIIFENLDTTAQTADLLFNFSCFGDTAYVPNPDDKIENAVDSNKKSMKAAWKSSSLGTIKQITSSGNVVGDSIPGTTSAYQMMVNFLASKGSQSLTKALGFNGKDAQTTIDETAAALGLNKGDVEKAIKEARETGANDGSGDKTDWSDKWDASKSSLPGESSGGSGSGGTSTADQHGYFLKNYYLTGSINGDNSGLTSVHKELRFKDNGTGDMLLSGVKLKEGDKVKVALYNGGKTFTLYPDGVGREVVIDKSGVYDFYFKPYELGNPNYWYITPSYVGEAKAGVKVSGKITSYLSDTDPISVLLMQDGKVKKNVNVKGNSAEYSFDDVEAGTYTMLVSKKNHVNCEYAVTVADSDVVRNVEIYPLGDITGDGKTNVQDCTAILRYVRKLDTELSDYQLSSADVTGEGKVNVQDVTRILRHVRKIENLYQ